MADVTVLYVNSDGSLTQLQDGDNLLTDNLNRKSTTGNITLGGNVSGAGEDVVIGSALSATGEVLLGSVSSQARVLGDFVVDGSLGAALDAGGFAITNIGTSLEVAGGGELRLWDVGDSNYVGFEAPALTANQIWILPATDSTGTQYLRSDGAGNLSWGTPAGGGDVTGPGAAVVDNTVVRWNGVSGTAVQGSGVTIDDSNNIFLDADASTTANPRHYGFVNFTTGEALRFDFGQVTGDGLQHSFGGAVTLYAEHTIILRGDRASASPPTYDTGISDIGVLIDNLTAASEALVVRGASSQTAALQEWRTSADAVLVDIQADGDVDLHNHDLDNAKTVTFNGVGSGSGTGTVDWSSFQKYQWTISGAATLTFTAPAGPCNVVLKLINGGTGTITWPASVDWAGQTEPSWTTTGTDIVAFYYDGTTYYGAASLDFG